MSLDKAIEHGREHRKPYRGSKAIDPMCRNHCGCDACEMNRKIATLRDDDRIRQEMRDEEAKGDA